MKSAKSTKWILESHRQKSLILFSALANTRWVYLFTLTCQIIVQQILIFFGKNFTYTSLLRPTCLLISEIFPSKPAYIGCTVYIYKKKAYINGKKSSLHALISLYSYMIIWSYTIIWQVQCIAYLYTGVFFGWKPFLFMFLVLLLSKFQNWNNYLDASFYGIKNISAIFQ